jgi:broad specificity phosphatase PhoE
MMSRLFLIRHGEPQQAWGVGEADPGLSDRGREQAAAAARALLWAGPLLALSSPMRRCRETADVFVSAAVIGPRIEQRVSEVATPLGVEDRRAWLQENFPWSTGSASRKWRSLDPQLHQWRQDLLDAARALEGDCAIFTHFIAINTIVGAALGRDETIICRPNYASITELALENDVLRVVSLGAEMEIGGVG